MADRTTSISGVSVDVESVGLKNVAEAVINPATEDKQDDMITAIEGISVGDIMGLKNVAETTINPATEDKQDDAITALTTDGVALKNVAEAVINPATEDKQDDMITAIEGISVGDIMGLKNVAETTINPATEDKQDDAITALTTDGVAIKDSADAVIDPATSADITDMIDKLGGLVKVDYDYISLSYTGTNLTGVVYKNGGSGGSTVATLTLAYDGSDNLETVTLS